MDQDFDAVEIELDSLNIPDQTGGVSDGDRRALYYLVAGLGALDVLEIGTHIGASTVYLAAALRKFADAGQPVSLTTVDVRDVNCLQTKPWLEYGSSSSPVELAEMIRVDSFVSFVVDDSLDYLRNCERHFDVVFLDGDHSAATVYQEIPAAVSCLKPNGAILLHDYYPDLKPISKGRAVIPGPYLALERYRREGVRVEAQPLGRLPWVSDQERRVTSLALVSQRD